MHGKFILDRNFLRRLSSQCLMVSNSFYSSGGYSIPSPSSSQLRVLLETSFWASLAKVEGRSHRFSIIFFPADEERAPEPFRFDHPLPFTPENLSNLAPALDPTDWSIGIWPDKKGALVIWGFAPFTMFLEMAFRVQSFDAGQLLVSFECTSHGFRAFITGSVAEFVTLGGLGLSYFARERTNATLDFHSGICLERAIRAMRAHGHGGTLLVVPANDSWSRSIQQPIRFRGEPYRKVKSEVNTEAAIVDEEYAKPENKNKLWISTRETLIATERRNAAASALGRLTAIDGATLVNYDLTILAFGVKIRPASDQEMPLVLVSEPFENSIRSRVRVSDLGGTRHQSAARFVFDQQDALAVVASQDGVISLLAWDKRESVLSVVRHWELAILWRGLQ